jgi:hypothetical protein
MTAFAETKKGPLAPAGNDPRRWFGKLKECGGRSAFSVAI